jgi:hypothetical protein
MEAMSCVAVAITTSIGKVEITGTCLKFGDAELSAVIPASRAERDNGEAGPKGERAARVKRGPSGFRRLEAEDTGFPLSQE